jgi:hypothetical protein
MMIEANHSPISGPLNGFPALPITMSGLIQRIQNPPANHPSIFGL